MPRVLIQACFSFVGPVCDAEVFLCAPCGVLCASAVKERIFIRSSRVKDARKARPTLPEEGGRHKMEIPTAVAE
jgi:hypothetical protein